MSRAAKVEAVIDGERERRAAELRRVDAENQMMHDRIADEGDLDDVLDADAGFGGHLAGEFVEDAWRTSAVSSLSPPGFIMM